jgi:iron complex outermembrane receptor protein
MRKISKLIALTMLLSFSWSQTSGKIRGTVSSSDGQPLVGANVVVTGTAKGAATDGDGSYTILNVDAGTYSVTVSYIGYQSNANICS